MDASLVQTVVAVFTALLLSAWHQHRENRKTREETVRLIERSTDNLQAGFTKSHDNLRTEFTKSHDNLRTEFTKSHDNLRTEFTKSHDNLRTEFTKSHDNLRAEFTKSHDNLRAEFTEHRRNTEKNHAEVMQSLGDARERLARVEGFLRFGWTEPPEAAAGA